MMLSYVVSILILLYFLISYLVLFKDVLYTVVLSPTQKGKYRLKSIFINYNIIVRA